jgi:hypothetical protein
MISAFGHHNHSCIIIIIIVQQLLDYWSLHIHIYEQIPSLKIDGLPRQVVLELNPIIVILQISTSYNGKPEQEQEPTPGALRQPSALGGTRVVAWHALAILQRVAREIPQCTARVH